MKRIFLLLLSFAAVYAYSQSSITTFVGLDTIKSKLKMDSTQIESNSPQLSLLNVSSIDSLSFIPNSRPIDHTKSVGEIEYNLTTTPSGGVQLVVPINVMPNPRGLTPEIALTYSSVAGNGYLGYGWSLSGLSSVTGIDRSVYYDGKVERVVPRNGSNSLALDGLRLIKTNNDIEFYEYQTERGRIKVHGRYEEGLLYEVSANFPDGRKIDYGTTTQGTKGEACDDITYYCKQMTDVKGNTINYEYERVGNDIRIKSIIYGLKKQCSIVFVYNNNRQDVERHFINNEEYKTDYLIQQIIAYYQNHEVRRYNFYYDILQNVSVLSQISCSAGNKQLNPLSFYYGYREKNKYQKKDIQLPQWFNFYDNPNLIRVGKGKFEYGSDNDGIFMLPNKIQYKLSVSGEQGRQLDFKFNNDYTGDESILLATYLGDDYPLRLPTLKTGKGFIDAFCMDVDDNEGEEFIVINDNYANAQDKLDFHVYTPSVYTGLTKKYTRTFYLPDFLRTDNNTLSTSPYPKFFYTGDFDGDGKTEILMSSVVCKEPSTSFQKYIDTSLRGYIFDLETNKIEYTKNFDFTFTYRFPTEGTWQLSTSDAAKQSDRFYILDYDGDGKTDFV